MQYSTAGAEHEANTTDTESLTAVSVQLWVPPLESPA